MQKKLYWLLGNVKTVKTKAKVFSSLYFSHMDGNIQVWDCVNMRERQTFQGHRGAVTCLSFDKLGGRLISGANVTSFSLRIQLGVPLFL